MTTGLRRAAGTSSAFPSASESAVRTSTADIVWYTQNAVKGEVRYGTSPDNLDKSVAETEATTDHIVTITGVTGHQVYYYQVVAGNAQWAMGSFVAGHRKWDNAAFNFVVFGDSGADGNVYNGEPGVNQSAVRELLEDFFDPETQVGSTYGPPDFFLHVGDFVCNYPYKNWFDREFFGFYKNLLLQAPIYTAIGNHEAKRDGKGNYLEAMELPEGEAAGGEKYYSFNWHNVHFVCLDTTQDSGASPGVWDPESSQAQWLEGDLSANGNHQSWIVVFFHHPPYANPLHDPGSNVCELRQLFDVFRRHHVDVVFSGHSHFYERTHPLTTDGRSTCPTPSDPAYDDDYYPGPKGTIYVTTGGGGRSLNDTAHKSWLAKEIKDFHVVCVSVEGLQMTLTMIDDDGVARDTVTLTKPAYKFNRADTNQDSAIDNADSVEILGYLFGDSYGNACLDAYDVNDDGMITIADSIYLLGYLFSGGSPPPAPFHNPYEARDCGTDPTEDNLGCDKFDPAETPGEWGSGWDL